MTFTGTKFAANIKSLGSYLGTLQNVSFENFVLHDVGKAINIDLDGQSQGAGSQRGTGTGTGRDVGTILVRNVTFRNFTGSAAVAGTFDCPGSGEQCAGIVLADIDITGTTQGFTCEGGVQGLAVRCSPKAPCLGLSKPCTFGMDAEPPMPPPPPPPPAAPPTHLKSWKPVSEISIDLLMPPAVND
eukprot:gene1425-15847_t